MENTKKIVEHSSWYKQGFFSSKKTPAPTAARLCLESNHNGYNDWYLPTIKELSLIYKNIKSKRFKHEYWSSTEYGTSEVRATPTAYAKILDNAWYFDFKNGRKEYGYKDSKWQYYFRDLKPGEPNIKKVLGIRYF